MRYKPFKLILLLVLLTPLMVLANSDKLFTRVYNVDSVTLWRNINAVAGSNTKDSPDARLKAYFSKAGVNFNSEKAVYFSDSRGQIMVRATLPDFEIIGLCVEGLNQKPLLLEIKTRAVEIEEVLLQRLGFDWPKSTNFAAVLTAPQFSQALATIKREGNATSSAEETIRSVSDHQTHIGSKILDFKSASLDLLPTVMPDGFSIQAVLIPNTLEFTGYIEPGKFISTPGSGLGNPVVPSGRIPHFRVYETVENCKLWDGQTAVICQKIPEQISPAKKIQLTFVTMTMVNDLGKRIHTDKELLFYRDSIPLQPARQ